MSHHLGLSIGDSMAEIVEFVREGQEFTVTAIGEWPLTAPLTDQALSEHLDTFIRANSIVAGNISVALTTSRIIVHTFPAEAGTTHPQWTASARWELSRILPGKQSEGYITDAIALPPPPGRSGVEVLSVSLRRDDIAMLESAAGFSGMKISSIDADIFCAETIFLERTPGGPPPASLMVMVRKDRIDWTRLSGRVTVRYGTLPLGGDAAEDAIGKVFPTVGAVDKILLHGPMATAEVAQAVHAQHGIVAECLDPFATMGVPQTLPLVEHFMRTPQRFAAAVGAALRAEE
jgi:Tfp pilus assembly PilM family ATPase